MTTEEKIREVFSRNLSQLLKAKQSTQLELAQFMEVSNTTINNWVNGYKMPRMDKIDKICIYFGISRKELLTGNELLTLSQTSTLTPSEETHIKKYRQLDADGKERIDRQIDFELYQLEQNAENKEGRLA